MPEMIDTAPYSFTAEQNSIFQFVESGNGHGIIDAVAGAGKTTTIMECARFVKDKSSILFCAFNNSIASEIARKFREKGMNEVTVKTIHALGRHILQDNNNTGQPITLEEKKYDLILRSKEMQVILEPHFENILMLNGLVKDELDETMVFARKNHLNKIHFRLLDINQKYRATLSKDDASVFEEMVVHFGIFNDIEIKRRNFKEELNEYYECHIKLLNAGNILSQKTMKIDYTDMLYLPYVWNLNPVNKFEFLFIDECQDLSKSQFAIVAKYGKSDGRIMAVGDPRQSIYGFTGADIESFYRVKDYTRAKELSLTACFRCPKKVVELAKTIRTDMSGNKEAEGLVHNIIFEDVVKYARSGDLIISRLKAPIVLLVFHFIDKNIQVQIHEDEAWDIVNELKYLFKQDELQIVISNLDNGFEDLKMKVLKRWTWIIDKNAENISNSNERKIYIENENEYLKTRIEFLHRKYEQWKVDCKTMNDLLVQIMKYISATNNAIRLSTIHRAKGLENSRVFVLNYDELPFYRINQKEWERNQEVNLKYVAITRALDELYLIQSKKINKIEKEESLFDKLPFD